MNFSEAVSHSDGSWTALLEGRRGPGTQTHTHTQIRWRCFHVQVHRPSQALSIYVSINSHSLFTQHIDTRSYAHRQSFTHRLAPTLQGKNNHESDSTYAHLCAFSHSVSFCVCLFVLYSRCLPMQSWSFSKRPIQQKRNSTKYTT